MVARLDGRPEPLVVHDPRAPRDGAIAGLVPVAMFLTWLAIGGWGGDTGSLITSSLAIGVVCIVAGWIVGGRAGRGVARSLAAVIAYPLTAWFLFVPIGAIVSTADALWSAGSDQGPGVILEDLVGHLAYAFVTSLYVWIYLLPFGVGWLVTFRLIQRRMGPTPVTEGRENRGVTAPPRGATAPPRGATAPPRSTMGPLTQWAVWFGLGAVDAVLGGVGSLVLVVILGLAGIVVGTRGDVWSATSGLLTGFGLTWLALVGLQATSGGELDSAASWIMLGIVATAVGVAIGCGSIATRSRHKDR